MIDFINIVNKSDNSIKIENNFGNPTYDKFCVDDGEVLKKPYTFDHNLKINKSGIRGSIHKYSNFLFGNPEFENYNDFYFEDLVNTIDYLKIKYESDFKDTSLTSFEYGLNIKTSVPATDIINNNLFFYKMNTPNEVFNSKRKTLKFFKLYNYRIKIYDKAKHCNLPFNLLRIEVYYKKKEFAKLGIKNINDLTNKKIFNELHNDFKDKISNCLFIDDFKHIDNKESLKSLIYDFDHSNFNNATAKCKSKKELMNFLEEEDLTKTKNKLMFELDKKNNQLMNTYKFQL